MSLERQNMQNRLPELTDSALINVWRPLSPTCCWLTTKFLFIACTSRQDSPYPSIFLWPPVQRAIAVTAPVLRTKSTGIKNTWRLKSTACRLRSLPVLQWIIAPRKIHLVRTPGCNNVLDSDLEPHYDAMRVGEERISDTRTQFSFAWILCFNSLVLN